MEQGKNYHANRRFHVPAVGGKDAVELNRVGDLCQAALGKVRHENNGNDYLISRKSQYKAKNYHSVQSDESAERVEKSGGVIQHRLISNVNIGEYPDDKTAGSSGDASPYQHKYCPVKNRTDKDFSYLWTAIGRQLQGE